MSKNRMQGWLAVVVGGIGLLLVAFMGLWAYMTATPPLHPDPQTVPSVTHSAPAPLWRDAVAQGRQTIRAALAAQSLPGLSVAVGSGGQIVWAEGFGWSDLEDRTPVSPETRFRIGTASPALTSAAVGLLLEQGRLTLDDTIQTYVPAFPEKPWPVTLRQLMGHVAGVRHDGGDEGPLLSKRCERTVDGLPAFAGEPLRFQPGTQYRFSSYGWILVSAAIEAASGESLPTFMRRQVFEPLGMTDTRIDAVGEPVPHQATFYFPRFAAEPRYGLHLMREIDYSCYAGASAFLSTPTDLVRFAMAIDSGGLLQPATARMLQTSQRLVSGAETGYGLGWDLGTAALRGTDTRLVGHDGESLGGMVASFMTFPDYGLVVAVASNISYADTHAVAVGVAQAFAGQGKVPARQ